MQRDNVTIGKNCWKALERVIGLGYSRNDVFSDWLDLMLYAFLSASDNFRRHPDFLQRLQENRLDGVYEEKYMAVVSRYKDAKRHPKEAMARFTEAAGECIRKTQAEQVDVLGDIFMGSITWGEHGQFFTPEGLTDAMADIQGIQPGNTVLDPACGSGRTLISAFKKQPKAIFTGVDLDHRCTRMCALNMHMLGMTGHAYWGNSLTVEYYTHWGIAGGLIVEHDCKAEKVAAAA